MSAPTSEPVVTAREISYRSLLEELIAPLSLMIQAGESWMITGPNGAGKSLLAEMLAGRREPTHGRVAWPGLPDGPRRDAAIVSFEEQEKIMERERREDTSGVMHGVLDPGHTPRDLIVAATGGNRETGEDGPAGEGRVSGEEDRPAIVARRFRIEHIMDRGLRFLSTGEFRKTLLAAAIVRDPRLLVLDDPYDGLDADAHRELERLIRELHSPDHALVLVLNRARDFPEGATHVVDLREGRARYVGPVGGWTGASEREGNTSSPIISRSKGGGAPRTWKSTSSPPLITMDKVAVSYGANHVLRDLSWTVRPQDRWMIHGPNGSGKSTLLSLILGDNPRAYGQNITLFGRRKGSGESVWEIKRRIGMVSGDFHLAYPHRTTALDTVISGFHDSLGLYERPSGYEVEVARGWLERVGLSGREDARLRELSFGQVRMLLVARAVVKQPEVLIADEPTQGLDDHHAEQVLALLDEIGLRRSALLYVTHNADESLRCLTHDLELVPDPHGGSRGVTRELE